MALVNITKKAPQKGSEGHQHLSLLAAAASESNEYAVGHSVEIGTRRVSDPSLVDAMIGCGRSRHVRRHLSLSEMEGDWD